MSDDINMVGIGISFQHHFVFIVHAYLFRHADRSDIGWVDDRDQAFDAEGVECNVAYGAGSFGCIALSPGGACQSLTNLYL